jgi:parallel beta-helix repeat protein
MKERLRKNNIEKSLAVGIILLFIGTAIIPSNGQDTRKSSSPTSTGNTLYVGGSGPGNYSRIQDAVNASANGDTVFVYDDSSPYYEHVIVNKPLTLKGEDKETTIIDGTLSGSVVSLLANNTEISGFTIQNSGTNYSTPDSGIWSYGRPLHSLKIFNNILRNNQDGVSIAYCQKISITNNTFIDNIEGIWLIASKHMMFSQNLMEHNTDAIGFIDLSWTTFINNTISDNDLGIGGGGILGFLLFSHNIIHANTDGLWFAGLTFTCLIIKNEFSNNTNGLGLWDCTGVRVKDNNFISNDVDASFQNFIFHLRIAVFRHNYWDDNMWPLPKIIRGELMSYAGYNYYYYMWYLFDWFPAQKPYDISGLR